MFEHKIKRPLKKLYHILQSAVADVTSGSPSKHLKIIAVSGTSGKSTTSTMVFHLLKTSGFHVGLVSTVEAVAGEEKFDTGFHVTTPDPIELIKFLKKMQEKSMEYVVLETSSHALDQGRLGLLKIFAAVFTNIKRDHLDYHITWENYAHAKSMLLEKLLPNGFALINKDDSDSFVYLTKRYRSLNLPDDNLTSYSASIEIKDAKESADGLSFKYKNIDFNIPVLGKYNLENALAAIKVAEKLGIKIEKIAEHFKTFEGVVGRMQIMRKEPSLVIVDFAHNTDSLTKSLESARKLVGQGGKLITVFGSAGLRDKEKRFTMGEASGKLADITIVTAEDPRIESLFTINTRIIEGAKKSGAKLIKRFENHQGYLEFQKSFETSPTDKRSSLSTGGEGRGEVYAFDQEAVDSRFDAIDFAIKISKPGDVVITEGKGHEQTLCFGTTEYPFTDQEAVARAFSDQPSTNSHKPVN